ncbi:MAG: hypothetical protein RIQ81_2727 [Pseudomonadota bacterium]|jgi:hypothetical protein
MNTKQLFDQRNDLNLKPSANLRGAITFCLAVGLLTIAAGFYLGMKERIWGSLLLNTFFFFAIALGGSAFAAMQDVIGATWGRPVMRLHEAFSSFLPFAAIVFILFFVAIKFDVANARNVYSWIKDPAIIHHFWGKRTWLVENFMLIRDSVAILALVGLARWQIGMKVQRDRMFVAGKKEEAERHGKAVQAKLRYWSAPVLVAYAILFSLLCFDMLMSLAPTWFSTLWGGWNFAIMMQTLMATLLITMFMISGTTVGGIIKRQHFHDVGKLMHGFTIFFAYLTYAHILTYWYGNIPEETEYFIHRLHAPWIYIVIAAPIMSFLIPLFALLPKVSKWTPQITIPLASLILFAQWLAYVLVVQPQVVSAGSWRSPLLEVGVFFGVLGVFMLTFLRFAGKNPMVAVADPLFAESLADGHH